MRAKLFIFISFVCLVSFAVEAQQLPSEIKYKVWDIHALRHYPFTVSADSIIEKVMLNHVEKPEGESQKQTTVDFVIDKRHLNNLRYHSMLKKDLLYKHVLNPYRFWLDELKLIEDDAQDLQLTVHASSEDNEIEDRYEGIFDFPGNYTTSQVLNDFIGEMDVFSPKNDLLLTFLSGPLYPGAMKRYSYFLSSETAIDGKPCYEIVFLSKKEQDLATEGFLYISKDDYSLQRAIFTINYALPVKMGRTILMNHTFTDNVIRKKETKILLGDDVEGGVLLTQTEDYFTAGSPHPDSDIGERGKQLQELIPVSHDTRAWQNVQTLGSLFLTDYIPLGKHDYFELGRVSQIISYNNMEGLRLKLGGATTTALNNHFSFGGYVAYGFKDEHFKYRGDIHYSLKPRKDSFWEFPYSLLSFSYVDDLNVPGKDIFTSTRDNIFNVLSYRHINNMPRQQIGKLSFGHEYKNHFSFKVDLKHMRESSMGKVEYNNIKTSELGLSLRFAPNEKAIQLRDKRTYLRRGDIELNLTHRIGIEGVLGSNYNYHITDFSALKRFNLPDNSGNLDLKLSAGKVWNSVPFPLLFIPRGNQTYIFSSEDYSLMRFYEFITDNYIGGNINFQFNWSPVKLVYSRSKIRTHLEGRVLYGPLSDKNDPALHPALFPFNNGVTPLGNDPYAEISIGFSNIFRLFRIDYARRLTYTGINDASKGSVFIGTIFSF